MNKFEHATLLNKPRVVFNFLQIHEDLLSNNIKLDSRIYNYLIDLSHEVFMQANIKYEYFLVGVYFNN